MGGGASVPRWIRWLSVAAFVVVLYDATTFVTIYALKAPLFVQVFYAPLFAVAIAGLVFWRRQLWRLRARALEAEIKQRNNMLSSLAHEVANGSNAIRANLTALREAHSSLITAERLDQVEQALQRLDQVATVCVRGQQ